MSTPDQLRSRLDGRPLHEGLEGLFIDVLNWGYADGLSEKAIVVKEAQWKGTAPAESLRLNAMPVAQAGGVPVYLIHLPSGARLPGSLGRREAFRALASEAAEHLLVFVAPEGSACEFVWARRRPGGPPEMRILPYEQGEAARTTLEQLEKLRLAEGDWDSLAKVLSRMKEAFSVEKLTKDFFTRLSELFYDTCDALAKSFRDENMRRLFVQTLFNRLIFLRFVEKKGTKEQRWLNFNDRSDYLRALWEAGQDSEFKFWPHRLNALFKAVNRERTDECHQESVHLIGSVVYLNGGLFEDVLAFDRYLKLPESLFRDLVGPDGLLYRYNFTVEESSPLDVQVAVDPEILGKIFEQLTISGKRHDTGSYYTPREIVQFMCREALVGYLSSDPLAPMNGRERGQGVKGPGLSEEKARNLVYDHDSSTLSNNEGQQAWDALFAIKVVDPACGSGAYLLGMLQELYALITILDRPDPRLGDDPAKREHARKLWIIENNIYGVDLQAFATNTAMLRLWLTLLVEDTGQTPQPLPNLEYKIETGDSLLGPDPREPIDWSKSQRGLDFENVHDTVEALRTLRSEYQGLHGEVKTEAKTEFETKLAELREKVTGQAEKDRTKFNWRVEFFDVFLDDPKNRPPGFDAVLANPPFVRYQLLRNIRPALHRLYPEVYSGAADLLVYFLGRSCQLVRPGGFIVFITSNQWLRKEYGEPLCAYLARETHVQTIVDFGDLPVFESTNAYAAVFVFNRSLPGPTTYVEVPDLTDPYPDVRAVIASYGKRLPHEALGHQRWFLGRELMYQEFESMIASGPTLGALLDETNLTIRSGVKTGANDIFYVDRITATRLSHELGSEWVCDALQTAEVKRWKPSAPETAIILARNGVEAPSRILEHLRPEKQRLTNRGARGTHWYQLRACTFYEEFTRPFIAFPDIAIGPRFALVDEPRVADYTVQFIPTNDLFLLAILNSRPAFRFVLEMSGRQRGGYVRFQENVLRLLPIPRASDADRTAVEVIVQRILNLKAVDPEADVSGLEAEIDRRVEFLYFHAEEAPSYDARLAQHEAERGTLIEEVRNLLAPGHETMTLEFKSSLGWDMKKDEPADYLPAECHIAICAFLNAGGGDLLIGVDDDATVIGLERDTTRYGSLTKIVETLENAFGKTLTHPLGKVKTTFITLDGMTILRVRVTGDPSSMYKYKEQIYVRRNSGSKPPLTPEEAGRWWSQRQRGDA